jgi:rhomboid protease GluP
MWGLSSILGKVGRTVPLDQVVIGGTVFLYLCMLAVDPGGIRTSGGLFNLLAPSSESLFRFGASGAVPVWVLDRWWTLLSAGWLHGSLLHIGFNIYWVRYLAPETAELYGASRMVILYTLSSAFAFLLSSTIGRFLPFLGGAGITVGASAPILGLLGALVWYGRITGSRLVGRQAWTYAVVMILFGFVFPRVDNWAHIGGFAGGYMAAALLDPRTPERPGHVAAAIVCLVATVLAIAASLVVPLPPGLF